MGTTWPLTMPPKPGFVDCSLELEHAVAAGGSDFSLKVRSVDWLGRAWRFEGSLPAMPRYLAEPWICFQMSLDGPSGNFWLGDPDGRAPRGKAPPATALLVNGANPAGEDLPFDGGPLSVTELLAVGDYCQVGNSLYKAQKRVDTNGSGAGTITVRPFLREGIADNAPIILFGARGLFKLSPAMRSVRWTSDRMRRYTTAFSAIEDVQ